MPYNSFYSFALSGCVLIADPVALVYLVYAEHDWTCRCQSSRVARSRSSMCFHSRQQFVVHHMPTTAAPATASTVAIAFCRFAPTPFRILLFVSRGCGHTGDCPNLNWIIACSVLFFVSRCCCCCRVGKCFQLCLLIQLATAVQ